MGRRPDHCRLGRQGAAQTARHQEQLPQPRLARAPSHLEPGEWPGGEGGLCFCQVPLRLFLLQRWHPAPNGDRSCAVRKEQQQPTWLGLKADSNNPTPVCPPGPAFSFLTGRCLRCNLPDRASSPCQGRRLCRPASEPLSGPLSSDPEAICLKIGSLT